MFVFLVGQLETPCPMGLKDGFILHRELPSSLWVLRMTERHLICYLVPTKEVLHHLVLLCFQVRSLLCCGMKGHTRQQCLALRNGNFCSFSWLSEHLASPPARWSDTLTCLLLPPPLTWLADTPYLLAPFFHYLCFFFLQCLGWLTCTCSSSWSWTILFSKVHSDTVTLEKQDQRAQLMTDGSRSVICVSRKWKGSALVPELNYRVFLVWMWNQQAVSCHSLCPGCEFPLSPVLNSSFS